MNLTFDALADGLAEDGYAVIDDFLSHKEVKNILNLKEFQSGSEFFKKAGIGKNQNHHINESVRGDYIFWIDKNAASDELKVYLSRLGDLIQFLNESLFLSLKDCEVHMTSYPPGSFYKRHLDQFNRDDHRKLSVICYLNDNWNADEGGQLRMFLADKIVDVLPTAGRLVCFRSDQIEHEVLPATRTRLSLTGWILDQYASLKHL
ncbi:MAG TPA: 2OG-Fe(II) oxygenase [Chryseolinea sp.]|nr:2OG-Fe(II) oxygenase [Chryseolinea sp.]